MNRQIPQIVFDTSYDISASVTDYNRGNKSKSCFFFGTRYTLRLEIDIFCPRIPFHSFFVRRPFQREWKKSKMRRMNDERLQRMQRKWTLNFHVFFLIFCRRFISMNFKNVSSSSTFFISLTPLFCEVFFRFFFVFWNLSRDKSTEIGGEIHKVESCSRKNTKKEEKLVDCKFYDSQNIQHEFFFARLAYQSRS